MTKQSKVFGAGGGGGEGAFPLHLSNTSVSLNAAEINSDSLGQANQTISGFNRDGDSIAFPETTAGSLQYINNNGTVVWSKLYNQFTGTGGGDWAGFFLGDDGLLYVILSWFPGNARMLLDISTIDDAGTITYVGQADVQNNTTLLADWHTGNSTAGSSDIFPLKGTTHAVIMTQGTNQNGSSWAVFDYTTAAVISNRAAMLRGQGRFYPPDDNGLVFRASFDTQTKISIHAFLNPDITDLSLNLFWDGAKDPLDLTQTSTSKFIYRGDPVEPTIWSTNSAAARSGVNNQRLRVFTVEDLTAANARWMKQLGGIDV